MKKVKKELVVFGSGAKSAYVEQLKKAQTKAKKVELKGKPRGIQR